MAAQNEFNRQQIVDSFSKVGEVFGRLIALALDAGERFLAAPKAKHPELEMDLFEEFNRKAAARVLDIGTTKLDEDTKAGLIAARRVGNQLMFIRAELERYRKEHLSKPEVE